MNNVPILILIFNRPEHVSQLIDRLRIFQPSNLYVAADGCRANNENDLINVFKSRNLIDNIDWDCKITKLYRDENLGCGKAVSQGITWFFDQVPYGIILEDDCLPISSFIGFCEKLLKYYQDNSKIMHISGNNFQLGQARGDASYYFSVYPHIWGWATWRRAWNLYEYDLPNPDSIRKVNERYRYLPFRGMKATYEGRFNTWDYQWVYTLYKYDGIAILPQVNLVQNIGFGSGTHTAGDAPFFFNQLVYGEIEEVVHVDPKEIIEYNSKADDFTNDLLYNKSFITKLKTFFHNNFFTIY